MTFDEYGVRVDGLLWICLLAVIDGWMGGGVGYCLAGLSWLITMMDESASKWYGKSNNPQSKCLASRKERGREKKKCLLSCSILPSEKKQGETLPFVALALTLAFGDVSEILRLE
jgi:hypothetical protein